MKLFGWRVKYCVNKWISASVSINCNCFFDQLISSFFLTKTVASLVSSENTNSYNIIYYIIIINLRGCRKDHQTCLNQTHLLFFKISQVQIRKSRFWCKNGISGLGEIMMISTVTCTAIPNMFQPNLHFIFQNFSSPGAKNIFWQSTPASGPEGVDDWRSNTDRVPW